MRVLAGAATATLLFFPVHNVMGQDGGNTIICPPMFYPAVAVRERQQGDVEVMATIGTDGIIHDAQVTKSSNRRFNDFSLICVKTFRYKPATMDGQPIEFPVKFTVLWRLDTSGKPVPGTFEVNTSPP